MSTSTNDRLWLRWQNQWMCIRFILRANSADSIAAPLVNMSAKAGLSLPAIKSRPQTLRSATLLWLLDSSIKATFPGDSSKSTACRLPLTEGPSGLDDKYKNAKPVQDLPWACIVN